MSCCCFGVISRLSQAKTAPLVGQTVAHFLGVEVGHHGGEQLDRLVDIDQPLWLAEQRGRLHVGRQHLAVAVDDVGPRGRDRITADNGAVPRPSGVMA